jgi:HEAT repeat protein
MALSFHLRRVMFLVTWVALGHVADCEDVVSVAGQTVDQVASQIANENRTIRLRAVKTLGVFGQPAGKALAAALGHEDAAVRYTAAIHLGNLRGDALTDALPQLSKLITEDSSQATQMAVAYALCRAGKLDVGLPVLLERLQRPSRAIATSAAELLGMIGPAASAALDQLQAVADANRPGGSGDYHIGGATKAAITKIKATSP